jgi:hypothetical protein
VSNLIRVLLVLVLLVVAAQVVIPRLAGEELGRALMRVTGPGSTDTVSVGAVPFFELFQGRFQSLDWRATNVAAEGLKLSAVDVTWTHGGISVPALVDHHAVVVSDPGDLQATVRVGETALARFLNASGRIQGSQVTVGPSTVRLRGTVSVGGLSGPIDTTGRLKLSPNGRQILFQPVSVDGFGLPFQTTLVILDVQTLNLPVSVRVTGVRLEPPYVVVTAQSP